MGISCGIIMGWEDLLQTNGMFSFTASFTVRFNWALPVDLWVLLGVFIYHQGMGFFLSYKDEGLYKIGCHSLNEQ